MVAVDIQAAVVDIGQVAAAVVVDIGQVAAADAHGQDVTEAVWTHLAVDVNHIVHGASGSRGTVEVEAEVEEDRGMGADGTGHRNTAVQRTGHTRRVSADEWTR